MKTIKLKRIMSDEDARKQYAGKLLDENSYDVLLANEDIKAVDEDGLPLVILRSGVLPLAYCKLAFDGLEESARGGSSNRGMASGIARVRNLTESIGVLKEGGTRFYPMKKEGTISTTNCSVNSSRMMGILKQHPEAIFEVQNADGSWTETQAQHTESGIVGYFDRNPRFSYCRLTAYNINHPTRFANAMPLIKRVDEVFAESHPQRYENQRRVVEETEPDFYISGTVFSTITVNMNWQTAVHKDKGDYKDGFGVLCAIRKGHYTGGYFVLPEYRVAVDMRTGDVMLADVHKWHGNTPMVADGGKPFKRMSLVFYYREKMKECGTAEDELRIAQNNHGRTHLDW